MTNPTHAEVMRNTALTQISVALTNIANELKAIRLAQHEIAANSAELAKHFCQK